jgi:hypothetical protein
VLLGIALTAVFVGSFALGFVAPTWLRRIAPLAIAGVAWLVAFTLMGIGFWGMTSCEFIVHYGVAHRPLMFPIILGLGVLMAAFASGFCGRIWSKTTLPGAILGAIIFVGAMWGLNYLAQHVSAFRC